MISHEAGVFRLELYVVDARSGVQRVPPPILFPHSLDAHPSAAPYTSFAMLKAAKSKTHQGRHLHIPAHGNSKTPQPVTVQWPLSNACAHGKTHSRCASRLRLGRLLLLRHDLCLFLLLRGFFLILALQRLPLLLALLPRLEEALEPALLLRVQALAQPRGAAAHAVLAEALFLDQELDQPGHVGRLPLEIAGRVVGGAHVRVQEQLARVGVRVVVGDGELALERAVAHLVHERGERFVLANQLERHDGSDFGDRVEVVAAEQHAEVDELWWRAPSVVPAISNLGGCVGVCCITWSISISSPSSTLSR